MCAEVSLVIENFVHACLHERINEKCPFICIRINKSWIGFCTMGFSIQCMPQQSRLLIE